MFTYAFEEYCLHMHGKNTVQVLGILLPVRGRSRKWILAACALHWSSHKAGQGHLLPIIWGGCLFGEAVYLKFIWLFIWDLFGQAVFWGFISGRLFIYSYKAGQGFLPIGGGWIPAVALSKMMDASHAKNIQTCTIWKQEKLSKKEGWAGTAKTTISL